jgi:hypothetical protein
MNRDAGLSRAMRLVAAHLRTAEMYERLARVAEEWGDKRRADDYRRCSRMHLLEVPPGPAVDLVRQSRCPEEPSA